MRGASNGVPRDRLDVLATAGRPKATEDSVSQCGNAAKWRSHS